MKKKIKCELCGSKKKTTKCRTLVKGRVLLEKAEVCDRCISRLISEGIYVTEIFDSESKIKNIDHIRNMSDFEMAEFLKVNRCNHCYEICMNNTRKEYHHSNINGHCVDGIKSWLNDSIESAE